MNPPVGAVEEGKQQELATPVDVVNTPMSAEDIKAAAIQAAQAAAEEVMRRFILQTPAKSNPTETPIATSMSVDQEEEDTVITSLVESGKVTISPASKGTLTKALISMRKTRDSSGAQKKLVFDKPDDTATAASKKARLGSNESSTSSISTHGRDGTGVGPPLENATLDSRKMAMFPRLESTEPALILNWRQSFQATANHHGWGGVLLHGEYLHKDVNGSYVGTPAIVNLCTSNGVQDVNLAAKWSNYLAKVSESIILVLLNVVKIPAIAAMVSVATIDKKSAKELWDSIGARYLNMNEYEKFKEQQHITNLRQESKTIEDFISIIEAKVANLRVRTLMTDKECETLLKNALLAGTNDEVRKDLNRIFENEWRIIAQTLIDNEKSTRINDKKHERANYVQDNRKFSAIRCKDCGNRGHKDKFFRDCSKHPNKAKNPHYEARSSQQKSCGWCGKSNHVMKDCRQKLAGRDPSPNTFAASKGWKSRIKANLGKEDSKE